MRILHVEDNTVDADLIRRSLKRLAPEIVLTQVTSLAEARQRLLQPAAYDLVLLDLRLPDGSGLELLGEIRQRQLELAVVVLTGSTDEQAVITALKAGADDYLDKQGEPARLAATLNQARKRFVERSSGLTSTLRVLYAEYSEADIDLTLRHMLQHAPHISLTIVKDAEEVLEKQPADASSPLDYDVLLLDYNLPRMNALELTKVLRLDRGLDIPIVLVSGQGNAAVAVEALRLGIDDFIIKHPGYLYGLVPTLEKAHKQAQLKKQQQALQTASQRLIHLVNTSPVILYSLHTHGETALATWVSGNIADQLGFTAAEALQPGWWISHIYPADIETATTAISSLLIKGEHTHEYRFVDANGNIRWIRDDMRLIRTTNANSHEITGSWRDISMEKRAEQIQQTRVAVLDLLGGNASLSEILYEIASRLEQICPRLRVSVLLLDQHSGCLRTAAAPSFPPEYAVAINGQMPITGNGACGTAAATGETVIVEDIQTHPYCVDYREFAAAIDIRACWSVPFKDEHGKVIGTVAANYHEPQSPLPEELSIIEEFARLTGLAVQRKRHLDEMRQAAIVFESTRDAVVIADLDHQILKVNRSFVEISGYSEEEMIGKPLNALHSGYHDESFYQSLWASVSDAGYWQGELWGRRKTGELFPQLATINLAHDEKGEPAHYVFVSTDISRLKASEEKLEHLAHYDSLTELPNRLLLNARLRHMIQQAARDKLIFAVLFLDLDRFKQINDSFGHLLGDKVLKAAAERLRHCVRANDTVARVGGDEFVILLEDIELPENASKVAEKILQSFIEPVDRSEQELYITPSIGISIYPRDGDSGETLLRNADTALYAAKNLGRNSYAFYREQQTTLAFQKVMLENCLRRAISANELKLEFQPQLDLHSGKLIGVEALARWQHHELGLVSPETFIPLAEETGIIIEIGDWVLQNACLQARQWLDQGIELGRITINVAGLQIKRGVILEQVQRALASSGLPAGRLELEVTEGFIMDEAETSIELLLSLRKLGVHLSIDDFGTGYSSLTYLKRLPIEQLKIDQSFVRDIPKDQEDVAIIKAIIALGQNLGMELIAEGIETEEQRQFLKEHGCSKGQGHLLAEPLTAKAFSAFVLALQQSRSDLGTASQTSVSR